MSNFKRGTATLVGRPNVGKSTLLNALLNRKVSIVSEKPQTTRSEILAVYESDRGQIFFSDTPGYFHGAGNSSFNSLIKESAKNTDVIVYVVDQSRDWGQEDEKVWHMVEGLSKPLILVINKADVVKPDYSHTYEILIGKHATKTIKLSATKRTHLNALIDAIYEVLPEGERDTSVDHYPTPLLSQTAPEFLAEIIREKIYDMCGAEVPYMVRTSVTSVDLDEEKNVLKVKGLIIVTDEHYKPMLIGANGRMVAKITKAVTKELWVATGSEAMVKLRVVSQEEFEEMV